MCYYIPYIIKDRKTIAQIEHMPIETLRGQKKRMNEEMYLLIIILKIGQI